MKNEEEELLDPVVTVALVLRIKISDLGRLEQYIKSSLYKPQIIYVQKTSSKRKLKIVEEAFEQ